jgi:cobalt-zinc-cadmium efflux system outer membrane protein
MRPVSALLAALLVSLPVLADGQPVADADAPLPAQLTLEEALRIFRVRGFDLLLADAQVASANGELSVAGASPNPVVSGSVAKSFNYDPSCMGCSAVGFSVGLSESGALSDLISNKRGLRIDVARAALAAAKSSREDSSRTLELALKQAWVSALQAEAQLKLSDETRASTETTRALNEKRFNLGAVSEADFARAEVAELEAEQLHDQALLALASAKAQLAFLLGVRSSTMPSFALDPHGLDYAATPSLAQLGSRAALPQDLLDAALTQRPDLLAQTQQVERAGSAVTLAKRARWGDPDLSVAYNQQGTGQNAIQPPTLTVGLSIPLPVLYRQQGEIAKAEADLRTQQVSLEKSRAQVTQDVRTAWAQFTAAHAQLERMDGRLQGRARRARDLIEVQYTKGAATLLDLLDAQRTLLTVSGERLTLLASYWNSVAQLEAATAKELRK